MTGIRAAILDDAPYLSWDGRVHAANATFHRFAAALLDVRDRAGDPVIADLVLAVPVRPATVPPMTLPVDPRIRVVATRPFDGIVGYLGRAPWLVVPNARSLRRAVTGADVLLLRLPASNGLLAAAVGVARGVPRVALVVGSVSDVVAGQGRTGLPSVAARVTAAGYDAATWLVGLGAARVVLGQDPAGGGILSSLVRPGEIRDRAAAPWPSSPPRLTLAYAGRLASGKGLDDLLAAVATLAAGPVAASDDSGPHEIGHGSGGRAGLDVHLDLIGDGPDGAALASRAASLGIDQRVRFVGYLADREPYLRALEEADMFVSASPAEGFPKAVLDAMAAGLPVVAVPAGGLAELAAADATAHGAAILPVRAGEPASLARAVRCLVDDPSAARRLRAAGTAFVADHTMPAEAARLAAIMRDQAARVRSRSTVR